MVWQSGIGSSVRVAIRIGMDRQSRNASVWQVTLSTGAYGQSWRVVSRRCVIWIAAVWQSGIGVVSTVMGRLGMAVSECQRSDCSDRV